MHTPEGVNQAAWNEFEQHRQDIKHPLTDLARKKAWALLSQYGHADQQTIIDTSIISGWRGLFHLSTNRMIQPKTPNTKFQRMQNALRTH